MKRSLALAAMILFTIIPAGAAARDRGYDDEENATRSHAHPDNGSLRQKIKNNARQVGHGIKKTAKQIKHGIKNGVKKGAREVKEGVKETFR